jgi:hypothetical protein
MLPTCSLSTVNRTFAVMHAVSQIEQLTILNEINVITTQCLLFSSFTSS